ncbi:MAG: hypothetical protein HY318_16955, partial [Armatimonadetes bacterium]|nr:hypothetical protein [Armatimonadota bacterium]
LPLNAFWLVEMEMGATGSARSAGPFPTTFSLFANVVVWLTLLAALNAVLRRLTPRYAFSTAELLTVYIMLSLGSALASVDFLDVLVPMMGHPTWFAAPENRWTQLILPHLPPAFYVSDKEALRGWYEGHATLYAPRVLRAWAPPVLLWSSFIFVLLGVMLCMATLVRRRWIERERLTFPVLCLPLALTEEKPTLWSSSLMWIGFGLAAGISLLNGLSVLYPAIPGLRIKCWDVGPSFTDRPWSAIGWTPVSFYPFAIGLGYLLPLDLLFSTWFFFLWWKAERILSDVFGVYGYAARAPYVEEQCLGAYLAVAVTALWLIVRARGKTQGSRGARPAGELSLFTRVFREDRVAALGLIVGFAALVAFWRWAGLGIGWTILALLIYFGIAFACARMRAELGPPAHDLHNSGPERVLTTIFGQSAFSPRELTVLTYFYWFNRAYRSIPIAHQIEAFKLSERTRFSERRIVGVMLLTTVVGTLAGFWAHLHLGYRQGVSAKMAVHLVGFGGEAFNRLQSWLTAPQPPDKPASWAILFGFLQALSLQFVRLRVMGWPFHPLGLAVSGSYSVSTTWVPLLIAWTCKFCILRYGGVHLHRRATNFFLGLILGDYLFGCGWQLLGWILGISTYSFQQ